MMEDGLVRPVDEGTGGPLSPILKISCLTTSTKNWPGGGRGWLTNRALAHVRSSGGPASPTQRLFNLLGLPRILRPPKPNLVEPPWYGPVCPVVWEGWRREASPCPISRHERTLPPDLVSAAFIAPRLRRLAEQEVFLSPGLTVSRTPILGSWARRGPPSGRPVDCRFGVRTEVPAQRKIRPIGLRPEEESMSKAPALMVIGAHPDDCEITAGGTAALNSARGGRVVFVSLTNGDKGHQTLGGIALARRRRDEAQAAAAVCGAESVVFDNHDGELTPTLERRHELIRVIREFQPDVVMFPRPWTTIPTTATRGKSPKMQCTWFVSLASVIR